MHLPRGMIGRDVELGEIVVVELDVRAFGDGKTQIGEDRCDLVQHLGDRMDRALRVRARRQGDVDALEGQPRIEGFVGQRGLAPGDGVGDAVAQAR